ncbi:molybdopterin oxidoreductase, molybdopterin binding subunit [Aeropyrum pernix]|uniref:Molybdopterin oxidoreductase, molybdopterin binding subunit n=1 Tax=Aeropyrum pernix TaxID=56636 RepID=A0A401HBX6_AERPX|nr:tetrathionate reductase subunit A [Aeropyrum pernix]GBF09941.1 molybdopterin oxidoreductase, molybdopterin binding subunit [Aeropyrum pernix]
MVSRRDFVKGSIAIASLLVAGAGLQPVLSQLVRPKFERIAPDLQMGANVRYVFSSCLGCNVRCGIKARVVKVGDLEIVERIEGNPYHPYNRAVSLNGNGKLGSQHLRFSHLPYNTPVKEALTKWHGTLCPRGQDGIYYLYDPYRVLVPLKRAGPRGSGKWKPISWEQLIREVVEGGVIEETGERLPGLKDFFVYGKLREAGFEDPNAILSDMKKDVQEILEYAKKPETSYEDIVAKIEEFKEKWSRILGEKGLKLEDILIDPDRPDLGTRANMVAYLRGRGQGHTDYMSSRWIAGFGSVNWLRHTSACQLGYYAANYLWAGYTDIQPDPVSSKVIIMAGASMGRLHPGATGQGLLISRAGEGDLKIYYVNPTAPRTDAGGNIVWIPIKPGYDAALAFALIRWMIENEKYNREFLEIPNEEAAERKGYPVHSNATWLVIMEEGHEKWGEYLKAKDVGLEDSDKPVVFTGEGLATYDSVDKAEIDWEGEVVLTTGERVKVKTSFRILKDEALSRSIDQWLSIASPYEPGSSEFREWREKVLEMARDFADAAPMAGTYVHRGVGMHTNGEYAVWAYRALDTLVGNYHRKGGLLARAGHTKYNSYVYHVDTKGFGEPVKWGPPIDRHKAKYEDTLEYWLKVKKGENPYPAKRPWYPHTPEESYTEIFAGIAEEYPYKMGALILFYANPVLSANYGVKFIEVLKDTKKLPLFIAITTTINETMLYADYIVPDTTYLETGTLGMQYLYASSGGVLHAEAARSPVVMPLTQKIGEPDRYASFWEFFIDTGKALGMPGFGKGAIKGLKYNEGKSYDLDSLWDYIMRVYANAAMHAKDMGIIPENVPEEEVKFVEENYPIAKFKHLIPDEWPYVAYMLARGGVFTSYEESFHPNGVSKRSVPSKRKKFKKTLMLWNEDLAKTRNSITGAKFWGGPKYIPPSTYAPVKGGSKSFYGTPLREIYPESEYPFHLVFTTGPLFTKHRSQFYYAIKQIMPENYLVVNPKDAEKLGLETGDVVEVETPTGKFKAPVVVEPTVPPGVIMVPYGMGRWADTVVKKPSYFDLKDSRLASLINELPEREEIPEDAVNPVKRLPELKKKVLFTKSTPAYYNQAEPDKWRFNGITPNVVEMSDPSLGGWPLLSIIGAAQAYYFNVARIRKTGEKHEFEKTYPYIVW